MNSVSKYHHIEVVRNDVLAKASVKNIYELAQPVAIVLNSSSKQSILQKKSQVFTKILMELLTSNKPGYTKLKKSIANFKVRQGSSIGNKITLRKKLLYQFLDKLHIQILASTRDFMTVKRKSNTPINLGIPDSYVVSDIEFERFTVKSSPKLRGFSISIVPSVSGGKSVDLILSSFRIP